MGLQCCPARDPAEVARLLVLRLLLRRLLLPGPPRAGEAQGALPETETNLRPSEENQEALGGTAVHRPCLLLLQQLLPRQLQLLPLLPPLLLWPSVQRAEQAVAGPPEGLPLRAARLPREVEELLEGTPKRLQARPRLEEEPPRPSLPLQQQQLWRLP